MTESNSRNRCQLGRRLDNQGPRSVVSNQAQSDTSATGRLTCQTCGKRYVRKTWLEKHQDQCKQQRRITQWTVGNFDDTQEDQTQESTSQGEELDEIQDQTSAENGDARQKCTTKTKKDHPERLKLILWNCDKYNISEQEIKASCSIPKHTRFLRRGKGKGTRIELWFQSRHDLENYYEQRKRCVSKDLKKLRVQLGRSFTQRMKAKKLKQLNENHTTDTLISGSPALNHNRQSRIPEYFGNNNNSTARTGSAHDQVIHPQDEDRRNQVLIMQWNAQTLKRKMQDVAKYLIDKDVDIACISETRISDQYKLPKRLNKYKFILNQRIGREGGGTAILINKETAIVQKVDKHQYEDIEYIVAKVRFKDCCPIDIVSVYIPHMNDKALKHLQDMAVKLTNRSIICGDFNAKHILWGSTKTDPAGRNVMDWTMENNLIFLNTGEHTHISDKGGTSDTLDLSFVTSPLYNICRDWKVDEDGLDSDHHVITFHLDIYKPKQQFFGNGGKWKLDKANWAEYKRLIQTNLTQPTTSTTEEEATMDTFVKIIKEAASKSVPKTKGKKEMRGWETKEIKEAVRSKNRFRRKWKRTRNPVYRVEFNKWRAMVRKLKLEFKRNSWKSFVSKMNCQTSIGEVWKNFRAINGNANRNYPAIEQEGAMLTENKEKAEAFCEMYSDRSNIELTSGETLNTERDETRDECDVPFTRSELEMAIDELSGKATGKDEIHDEMIRMLPEEGRQRLQQAINELWENGSCPEYFKTSVIIPILKPRKNEHFIDSYRPIALTSCLGKLMERMINRRLQWRLEVGKHLSECQLGFRRNVGTVDCLIHISDAAKVAVETKRFALAVMLDLDKAFDTIWRRGIISKLEKFGIRGRMRNWINNFLTNQKIFVRIGDKESDTKETNAGTPQGSVLSPTLFNIMLADLQTSIQSKNITVFADDLTLWVIHSNINVAARLMQEILDKTHAWTEEWRLKLSPTKSEFTVFTRRIKFSVADIDLQINGQKIKYNPNPRILGVTFDQKLSWEKHVEETAKSCMKRLNVLKAVSHKTWGADFDTLRTLYLAFIRSKMMYGAEILGQLPQTRIQELEKLQNEGLRIILGSMKSTPIAAMQVEANIPPLRLYLEQIALRKWAKIELLEKNYNISRPREAGDINTFNSRGQRAARKQKLHINGAEAYKCLNPLPPWDWRVLPIVDSIPGIGNKDEEIPEIIKLKTLEHINEQYTQHIHIYTDGSQNLETEKSGAAVYIPQRKTKILLPSSKITIMDIELEAIHRALQEIDSLQLKNSVILTDSKSALQSLKRWEHPSETQCLLTKLLTLDVQLQWIPAHCNIEGNETADHLAKLASQMGPKQKPNLTPGEILGKIRNTFYTKWTEEWGKAQTGRKFYNIKCKPSKPTYGWMSRKEQVTLSRLRLGHFPSPDRLFAWKLVDSPSCPLCTQATGTIDHIVTTCPAIARSENILQSNLDTLLSDENSWLELTRIGEEWLRRNLIRGESPM